MFHTEESQGGGKEVCKHPPLPLLLGQRFFSQNVCVAKAKAGRGVKMREELRKLFRGRLICSLILLSVIVNAYLLYMQKDKIDVLHMIDDFCKENGSVVSEETKAALEAIWDEGNESGILWDEYENNLEKSTKYFDFVQSSDMAEAYSSSMHLSGKAAEYVRSEFHKLDGAIREAAEQELTFYPPFRTYTFDFISTYLLYAMNLEGMVIAVVMTLYCVDMERSNRTISTVYSTRKGKKIIKDKLFASVVGSLVCFFIIAVITVVMAGCFLPVKTIMNTLVSNPIVNLKGAPCMTKETMTVGNYIFFSLGISCILTVIYSLGSFYLGLKAKNGYYALGILIVLLGIMKMISTAAPTSTYMYFWSRYNPLDMALKAGTWFLYSAAHFSPSGYEGATVVLWIVVCAAGCIWGLRSVDRREEG